MGKAPEPAEGWGNLPEMKRVLNSRVPAEETETAVRIRGPAQAGEKAVALDAEWVVARAVAADEVDRFTSFIQ